MARIAWVAVVVGIALVSGCSAGTSSESAAVSSGAPSGASSGSAPEFAADAAVAPAPERAGEVGSEAVPVGSVDRSLVRTAQLTVEVDDTTGATGSVRAVAVAAGGFVAQEQIGDRGGVLVLRVPADALDRAVEQVAALGAVTDRSSSVVDATEEVVDLDARVASQQASVARVRSLLAEATSIGDVVAIESELARREADLDSLTGRLAALRDQVSLSTLTVDLRGPDAPVAGTEPPGFGDGLAAGWAGLLAVGTGLAAALGFLLPFVPLLAVVAGIVWLVARAVRRRRAASTS